jgi:hypothetical protein
MTHTYKPALMSYIDQLLPIRKNLKNSKTEKYFTVRRSKVLVLPARTLP